MLLASWPARAGAFAVDTVPGVGVVATMGLLALTAPGDGWLRWVFTLVGAAMLPVMALNRLVLPNAVGWTLGRALFGIAVRRREPNDSGANVGVMRLTLRELAHLLDTLALFVGWLWPLWDRRRRTFADLLVGTEVHRVGPPERDMRRLVGAVLVAAAVLCAAGVGVGYALIFRHERAVNEARMQIAAQGPRIVEQLLSYGADTAAAGFRPCADADHRQLPGAVDRPAAGRPGCRAKGSSHHERVLGGQEHCADQSSCDAGTGVDAHGDAGPARHESRGPQVHHRDGAGGLRQVAGRAVAGSQPDRAEEAADESGWPVSPRRRLDYSADTGATDTVGSDYFHATPKPPRRWGLPLVAAVAAVVVAAAIAASTFMLVRHEGDRRVAVNDAAALGYAREFMIMYMSLDPFNANAYAERILAQGTGEFATMFKEKQNEILIQVARSEPSTGTVLEAGVQRWNDDGSADVLLATKVTTTSPDGKSTIESGSRWIATTIKEGQQWKISKLIQVI